MKKIIALCRKQFPGDFDIQRQTRRLELALEDDGWRGNVETLIDQQFYGIDAAKNLATMSSVLAQSTLGSASKGLRKASRARDSTGSHQSSEKSVMERMI